MLGNCEKSHIGEIPAICYDYKAVLKQAFETRELLRIDINDSLRITGAKGARIVVRSKKGAAMIAMLLLAPDFLRNRIWLVQRLWGAKDQTQGKLSLRQELAQLRRLLNRDAEVLCADKSSVWIDPDLVKLAPLGSVETMIDWISLPHEPQTQAWVRDFRRSFVEQAPQVAAEAGFRLPDLCVEIISEPSLGDTRDSQLLREALQQTTCNILSEFGGLRVVDTKMALIKARPDVNISLSIKVFDTELRFNAVARRHDTGQILPLVTRTMPHHRGVMMNVGLISDQLANEVCEQFVSLIASISDRLFTPGYQSTKAAVLGIRALFSRSKSGYAIAEEQFELAIKLSDSSTFLAWRAYLSALALEEKDPIHHADIREKAQEDIETALAVEPHNGLTAALASQVYGFVLGNFDMAEKCLRHAIDRRPTHVMTQDAAALFSFYTGDLDAARRAAQRSEYLGQNVSFQYCFTTSLLMIETLAGNFRAGARYGERALALAPKSGAKPYPPTLRYLAICYAQTGEYDKAQGIVDRLGQLEGQEWTSRLRGKELLMPSADARELMIKSLKKIGR